MNKFKNLFLSMLLGIGVACGSSYAQKNDTKASDNANNYSSSPIEIKMDLSVLVDYHRLFFSSKKIKPELDVLVNSKVSSNVFKDDTTRSESFSARGSVNYPSGGFLVSASVDSNRDLGLEGRLNGDILNEKFSLLEVDGGVHYLSKLDGTKPRLVFDSGVAIGKDAILNLFLRWLQNLSYKNNMTSYVSKNNNFVGGGFIDWGVVQTGGYGIVQINPNKKNQYEEHVQLSLNLSNRENYEVMNGSIDAIPIDIMQIGDDINLLLNLGTSSNNRTPSGETYNMKSLEVAGDLKIVSASFWYKTFNFLNHKNLNIGYGLGFYPKDDIKFQIYYEINENDAKPEDKKNNLFGIVISSKTPL